MLSTSGMMQQQIDLLKKQVEQLESQINNQGEESSNDYKPTNRSITRNQAGNQHNAI
jgi:hypothetical protein